MVNWKYLFSFINNPMYWNISDIVRCLKFLHCTLDQSSSCNLCGALWIPGRRMCLGAWGRDWGEIITSINWTLGFGLSLKSLNDKSPLSLSPPRVSSGLYPGCSALILSTTSLAELHKPRQWPCSQENVFGFMPAWTLVLNWRLTFTATTVLFCAQFKNTDRCVFSYSVRSMWELWYSVVDCSCVVNACTYMLAWLIKVLTVFSLF